jgi:hypothetical protein
MDVVVRDPLHRAIILRQAARESLKGNDYRAIAALNSLADQAYSRLGPVQALAYIAWAKSPEFALLLDLQDIASRQFVLPVV